MKKNDINSALNRELSSVRLSDRLKRDIAYNAQHADRRVAKKQITYAAWTAAAMVVILGASLLISGTRVLPDLRREQPLAQGGSTPVLSSNVTEEGEGTGISETIENPEAESTMVPAEKRDLFLRYEYEQVIPVTDGEQMLWATQGGTYYHLVSDCSGMENAVQMSRSEVSAAHKLPCPVCIAFVTPTPMPAATIEILPTLTPTPMPTEQPFYRFYGMENGVYYHTDETCSGMKNAAWLSDLTGKSPCPVCIPYVTPTPMPVNAELTPEPTEMPEDVTYDAAATPEPTRAPENQGMNSIWGTENGTFYHIIDDCSGMQNAAWLSGLTGKSPCPNCIGESFWSTSEGAYFHILPDCSGMENAIECNSVTVNNSGKYPCPVCIGAVMADSTPTPMPTEMPDVVYDAQPTPEPEDRFVDVSLTRYTVDAGCIMELEYDYDREFALITEKPADLESWYVDDADADRFGTGGYLTGLIPPEDIAIFEETVAMNGEAGFEIRDAVILLDGVKTQFAGSIKDLPSGAEYRFTGTGQPKKCVLYSLNRPFEGDTAKTVTVERLQLYWFDGEKFYRQLAENSTKTRETTVGIRDGGEAVACQEPLDGFNFVGEMGVLTLEEDQYIIAVADDDSALSDSALIAADGSAFVPDMVINQTFHSDEIAGWRYPLEDADKFEFVRLSDGEHVSEVHLDIPGSDSASIMESLGFLLALGGVDDSAAIDKAVQSLILLDENGDITAMSSQPIRDILRATGLSDDEIAANYMVNSVIAILAGQQN